MQTTTVNKIYNLIILDESGSMETIKQATIGGFNELVQSVKASAIADKNLSQFINLFSFGGTTITEQLPLAPAEQIVQLTNQNYQPNNNTPLYDAIGKACNSLHQQLISQTNYAVLVTILTDGEENSSREYNQSAIKALIDALKIKGWVFTYIGANHNVEVVAKEMGINNHLQFNTVEEDMKVMYEINTKARMSFYEKIKVGKKVDIDFFE